MEIAIDKAKVTTGTGLKHIHTPLTWLHDIKSLPHRERIDGSTEH